MWFSPKYVFRIFYRRPTTAMLKAERFSDVIWAFKELGHNQDIWGHIADVQRTYILWKNIIARVSVGILWQNCSFTCIPFTFIEYYQFSHYRNTFSTNWNWTMICSNDRLTIRLNTRTVEAFELHYTTSYVNIFSTYILHTHVCDKLWTFRNITNWLHLFLTSDCKIISRL